MPKDGDDFRNLPIKTKPRVGERLRADVYDQQGVLLLRSGSVVQEEHWVPRLEGRETQQVAPRPQHQRPPVARSPWSELCRAEAEMLRGQTEIAKAAKQDAVRAVSSVFERIVHAEEVDVGALRSLVSSMISSLVNESRALLSLTMLKDADNYTHMHCVNVSVLAICLAMRVGYASDAEDIGIGGLVHDVGKIQIPLEILKKPGALTNGEAYVMRQHPLIGAKLLVRAGNFSPISVLCTRDHHESVDGRGYPCGKTAREICPQAQIVSVADVYDALTTDRPYRAALSPQQALTLMSQELSQAFSPNLLRALVGLIGYHPVGSRITLINGYEAVVLENDPGDPSRPSLVQTVAAPDGTPVPEAQFIDLRVNPHLISNSHADESLQNVAVPLVMRELRGFDALA